MKRILFCVLPVSSSLVVSTYLFQLTRQKLNAPVISQQQVGVVDMPTFKNKATNAFHLSLMVLYSSNPSCSSSPPPFGLPSLCSPTGSSTFAAFTSLTGQILGGCDQRVLMNWVAWVLLYLLTLNPIINPLITALIYAPYRLHLKNLLLNFPGNRLQYSSYRTGEITEHSQTSSSRRRNRERVNDVFVRQGQPDLSRAGEEGSSTTTSSSSQHPSSIPLAHIAYNSRNPSAGKAPPSPKNSAKSSTSPKSATAMFIFVDAETEEGENGGRMKS
uniref:G_PROTEIN_RECEP_F1_2 domain-containing protein n=1 Tax=Globodera pallida TaxID=36090 RepID=A0A183C8B2_GLOPA